MKRPLCIILALMTAVSICGCVGIGDGNMFGDISSSQSTPSSVSSELSHIEHVGKVPASFAGIISDDIFGSGDISGEKVIKMQVGDNSTDFQTYDIYGKKLASFSFDNENGTRSTELYPVSGDCYISVSCFSDHNISQGGNGANGDKSVSTATVFTRFNASGDIIAQTQSDDQLYLYLSSFLETDDGYLLVAECEDTAYKTVGLHGSTDIVIFKLDRNCNIIKTKRIVGSDYDSLSRAGAEYSDGILRLYIRAQSSDGDYPADGFWIFELDRDLEIIEKTATEYKDIPDKTLGTIGGKTIHDITEFDPDFDAGGVSSIIEYDDFVLIISTHATGIYENMPIYISSFWYYTETVYSAYSKDGKLIWRSAVDSTRYDLYEQPE